jgi:hypothetical protein
VVALFTVTVLSVAAPWIARGLQRTARTRGTLNAVEE